MIASSCPEIARRQFLDKNQVANIRSLAPQPRGLMAALDDQQQGPKQCKDTNPCTHLVRNAALCRREIIEDQPMYLKINAFFKLAWSVHYSLPSG